MQESAPNFTPLSYTFLKLREWGPFGRVNSYPLIVIVEKNGELKEELSRFLKIFANRNRSLGRSCICLPG